MKLIRIIIIFFFILTPNVFANIENEFNQWKNQFKDKALSNDISETTINLVINNLKFLPKVIEYDRYQPEFYEDTHTYISKRTNNNKVKKGLILYSKEKKLINQIESFNDLEEKGIVYKNYKWIFPFKHVELEESKAFCLALKREVELINKDWTVSIDTYNNNYDFVVIHGIRDPNEIEQIKSVDLFAKKYLFKNENFVTLASQYRDYIKNKTWINNTK